MGSTCQSVCQWPSSVLFTALSGFIDIIMKSSENVLTTFLTSWFHSYGSLPVAIYVRSKTQIKKTHIYKMYANIIHMVIYGLA